MRSIKELLGVRETQTAALILLSTIIIYRPFLTWLLSEYLHNPWANHGLIIPMAAAYILYKRLKDRPIKISQSRDSMITGAVIIFVAIGLRFLAGQTMSTMISLILYLFGTTILFYGRESLPVSFPTFLYLTFMYPIDVEALYSYGTNLSILTGKLSRLGLTILGIPASYAENPLPAFTLATKTGEMAPFIIDVPCMGTQQVIGYVAFAVFLMLINEKPSLVQKGVSFVLGLLLMPVLNVLRVTAILVVAYEFGNQTALGAFHTFGGWALFTAGVVMYLAITDWISKRPSSKIDLRQVIKPLMRPRNIKTALLIIIVATSLTLCVISQSAVNIKTTASNNGPADFHEADYNKNKIFDSLDDILENKTKDAILPVIVTFDDVQPGIGVAQLTEKIGFFNVKYTYASLPGMAANLTRGQIEALTHIPFIKHVEYDALVHIMLDDATYWFGVDKAVTDFSVDGNADGSATYSKDDIVIAILDTGIDVNHVDLDGGKVIGWKDFVNNQPNPYDDEGHGTHVSSIAAGTGEGNAAYKGVAPGAALVGVKVLNKKGTGRVSDVNAGIQWVIDNKATFGIEILNISLGISGSSDGTDSTSLLVNAAFDAGIVVTVSAGNEGPEKYTIGSPAAAEKAITVGAMADVGKLGFYLWVYSSRGPTADERIKPDLCAPGVSVTAADAGTTNGYVTYSGTSMSTPFMAGTVALMLHANSSLTPSDVKNMAMAVDWGLKGEVDIEYGYGRLDSYEAVRKAGSFTGSGPTVPGHAYKEGTLDATGDSDNWYFTVDATSYPFAITLIIPDWRPIFPIGTEPDFDLYLYDPDGSEIASSTGVERQETIAVSITKTGTYRVRVYSYYGSGDYFFDVSVGLAAGQADPPIYIPELPFGTILVLLTALLIAVVYRRRRKLAILQDG